MKPSSNMGRLDNQSNDVVFHGLVAFPKSRKKVGMLELMGAMAFAMTFLLLSVEAADKPPTLGYGIISHAPSSSSTNPAPVNYPTRVCNAGNYCRQFTLTVENPSGTRVKAFAIVEVGALLNNSAPGTEAIAAGIAAWYWSLNNKKSGRLSVSMNSTVDADSGQMLQREAVCRGIARIGQLDDPCRSTSMSSEETAGLPPVNGNITVTVDAASKRVDLKFMTLVESFGETDVIWIMKHAKAILAGGQ